MKPEICIYIFVLCFASVHAWDSEELEIFDLVEEVETNFYTLLGVPQDANATDIKKAYRRLSLQIHPDKNDAPDAEIRFRQLVAVYEVLRDAGKRALYDRVLENGLPDWRQAVYYYRRVRKMGLAEMTLILFVIITVGQYVVAWAAYLEKKYTAQQFLEARLKKLQKKQKKGKYEGPALPETIVLEIPSPRVWDTLPFQLPRLLWFVVTSCPQSLLLLKHLLVKRHEEVPESSSDEEEPVASQAVPRGPRRRKTKFAPPELDGNVATVTDKTVTDCQLPTSSESPPPVSGGLWTDDDLAELSRLVKRFPQGTAQRWDKIAASMGRPTAEVTHVARKLREDGFRPPQTAPRPEEVVQPRKVKTRAVDTPTGGTEWSQPQQKALEQALVRYPKGAATDRWDKIAKCVPGKTKEECMVRYRQLVELVKKKKEGESSEA